MYSICKYVKEFKPYFFKNNSYKNISEQLTNLITQLSVKECIETFIHHSIRILLIKIK